MQIPPPPPCITIHILHDNTLTEDNRDKLNYLVGRYGQQIKFYNVEKLCAEKIAEIKKMFATLTQSFTIGTMFRLLIADVVDKEIEKVIYLDADTIINLDINEFWNIELGENALGAPPDTASDVLQKEYSSHHYLQRANIVSPEDYFCSGVLLMNLKIFRKEKETIENAFEFVANSPCEYFDQDILNYCFSKRYLKLDGKFDYYVQNERILKTNFIGKKIYHYIGTNLQLATSDIFNKLWFKYFCKTPWFNEDIFGNLFEGVRKVYNEQKNFALATTKILAGKERGFFVEGANLDAVKNIFAVEDGEEIISGASIENLIQSMKKSHGRKIYFILAGYFPAVHQALTTQGFVFGKDFLNGFEFLSEAQGMFFDTNFLVNML